MTKKDIAQSIIVHKGNCGLLNCLKCPAYGTPCNTHFGSGLSGYTSAKLAWFKNWLKENDK